jgi:hypothetical protein
VALLSGGLPEGVDAIVCCLSTVLQFKAKAALDSDGAGFLFLNRLTSFVLCTGKSIHGTVQSWGQYTRWAVDNTADDVEFREIISVFMGTMSIERW